MNEANIDCTLLAGRCTLLDQNAGALLDKATATDMAIVIGGVFNSGILPAGGTDNRKFDYQNVDAAIALKTDRLVAICARFDVPLTAAAIQFPLRYKTVTSVLIGAKHPDRVRQKVAWFERSIPDALWQALEANGLPA